MMNTGIEKDIRYHLVKASDSKRDSYRAVMKHGALSARETIDEICNATYLPQHLIEHAISGTLDTMIRRTLGDSRNETPLAEMASSGKSSFPMRNLPNTGNFVPAGSPP